MTEPMPKGVSVSSVTIVTITAKCDRCKKTSSGQCSYNNHMMYVTEVLKYAVIKTNRTPRSAYPKRIFVCPACLIELEEFYVNGYLPKMEKDQ